MELTMDDNVVRFKIGEHYSDCVCLGRVGRKEIYVFLPIHRPGTPMPEYWPRGKSGIYADWYKVRIEDGVETVNCQYGYYRADTVRDLSFDFDMRKYETKKGEATNIKSTSVRRKREKPNALAGIVLIVLIVLFVRACCS